MHFALICRLCLGTQNLKPIFGERDDHDPYAAVNITTGIKIAKNDGLPQQMCANCTMFVDEALKFRLKCKDVENKLLSLKNVKYTLDSGVKEVRIHVKPKYSRRKTKSGNKSSIHIKIEPGAAKNVDDIHIKQLALPNDNITEDGNVKIETQCERKVNNEQETIEVFNDRVKTDNLALETQITQNGCKYETEFFNLDIDPNSDPEDLLKAEFPTSEYEIEIDNCDIKKLKADKMITKSDKLTSKSDKVTSKSDKVITKSDKVMTESDMQIFINNTINTIKKRESVDIFENDLFVILDTNRVICKLCNQNLSRRSIYTHIDKKHPGADVRKTKCELCDAYLLTHRLHRHKVLMHGYDCFKCRYCKNEYKSKEELLDHVTGTTCTAKATKRKYTKDKKKDPIVECDVCNKSMLKASLKKHKEIKHAGMGPVCEHCGRRFGNKLRLEGHLRAKHGFEKLKCSLCDFQSATAMALTNHERRHRGDKPYVCSRCGAAFHAPYLLRQHLHSHRTSRDVKCDQCPAAFKANNHLHTHKLTCHNNYSFQCPQCPRTFKSRGYVVKHLRTFHGHTGPVGPVALAVEDK